MNYSRSPAPTSRSPATPYRRRPPFPHSLIPQPSLLSFPRFFPRAVAVSTCPRPGNRRRRRPVVGTAVSCRRRGYWIWKFHDEADSRAGESYQVSGVLEAAGCKKGRVYGIRSSSTLYYSKTALSSSSKSSSSSASDTRVTALEAQLAKMMKMIEVLT
ncbi:hypothetical protein AKJ16_DCAP14147 [Drosera capensis]